MLDHSTPELAVAQQAAAAAGQVLLDFAQAGFTVREKGVSDLVSEADVAAETAVLARIRQAFPTHDVLAEESQTELTATNVPEHLWIIDPLDGTTNYVHGIPHYAVSIAYLRDGQPECGVVFNPAREDLFVAVRNQGAWHNGKRLSVGPQTSLADCLVGLGFYYDRGAMMEATLATVQALFQTGIHGVRRFGTASLDLSAVARGHYGAFFEYQLSAWDFAAGRLLVEEAGGRCTTALGEPLPIGRSSVLASNGTLHPVMEKIIREKAGHLFA